jgi:hypothetical protein
MINSIGFPIASRLVNPKSRSAAVFQRLIDPFQSTLTIAVITFPPSTISARRQLSAIGIQQADRLSCQVF